MLNEKLVAAQRVARAIGATELDNESSLLSGARLMISVIEGRRSTAAPHKDGQKIVMQVARGLMLTAKAQEAFVASHVLLAEKRDEWGISPKASGCTTSCLPGKATGSLELVTSTAA